VVQIVGEISIPAVAYSFINKQPNCNIHNKLLYFYFTVNRVIHRADQYFISPLITIVRHFKILIFNNPNFSI